MEDIFYSIALSLAPVYLIQIVSLWRIFLKAGKPGWAAIIPFYNIIVLLEIVKKPTWWILLLLVPGVNLVFSIWITNLLAKNFGKNESFTIGLILLSFIFYPLLGFGSPKYVHNQEPSKYDDLTEDTRSKIIIWALALTFISPLLYILFMRGGLLGFDDYTTYTTLTSIFSVFLGALIFLFGISVNIKYRNTAIILSTCLIIVERASYIIYPLIANI